MKKFKHKHDFLYGKTFAITSMGEIEFFKDRSCLAKNCSKYQLWFDKRWRDTIPGLSLESQENEIYSSS